MNHAFEDIEVKRNTLLILVDQLRRKRKKCMIGTGAMSDPYIHLEEELQMTRQCISIVEKYGFGLAIQTKSSRILRDLDLLKSIHQRTKCVVQMTLTTYDEDLCRKIEPNVSTTLERFHVLSIMRNEEIPTVVWLGPILPYINDTEENLRGILDYCVKANVRGIICFGFGVTMREGNREHFYKQIDKLFPRIKKEYIRDFGNSYICESPNQNRLMSIFKEVCEKHGILWKPNDVFSFLKQFEEKEQQLSLL